MNQTPSADVLAQLHATIQQRKASDAESSYVANLFEKGQDAILKKVAEEACEVVMASKDNNPDQVVYETADLWFHTLVLLSHHGLSPALVLAELSRRMGVSGLEEKANRKK